jgi:hypothetical protein
MCTERLIGLKDIASSADLLSMERSVITFSVLICSSAGSFVPELWGASSFSLASIAFGLIGGIAGVFIGARIASI